MKRKIFLSFRPEFFRPILYNMKMYEYRKRFCDEPTTAYLYLSAPVQEVIGIMELGKPIHTAEKIDDYNKGSIIYDRIKNCLKNGEKFAIPIESLQLFKQPISINKLKEIDSHFNVPQCYLNIQNFPAVYEYLEKQELYNKEYINSHSKLYEDNFCMTCKEMEMTEEFKLKDIEYTKNKKYDIIKAGYITRRTK